MKKDGQETVLKMMVNADAEAPKVYFWGSIIGYCVAIITTVIVMLVFEHGQPALLYLVPGCLLSVLINAARLGEFNALWEFNEEKIVEDDTSKKTE
jgi:minor histocompatibility antigen H13